MRSFLIKWLISALSLALASWLLGGIIIDSGWALLLAALVVGLLNAFVRPIVMLLTLPLNILTLGLFSFVINASMLMITSEIVNGFTVNSFWSALLTAVIMSLVSFFLNIFMGEDGKTGNKPRRRASVGIEEDRIIDVDAEEDRRAGGERD